MATALNPLACNAAALRRAEEKYRPQKGMTISLGRCRCGVQREFVVDEVCPERNYVGGVVQCDCMGGGYGAGWCTFEGFRELLDEEAARKERIRLAREKQADAEAAAK